MLPTNIQAPSSYLDHKIQQRANSFSSDHTERVHSSIAHPLALNLPEHLLDRLKQEDVNQNRTAYSLHLEQSNAYSLHLEQSPSPNRSQEAKHFAWEELESKVERSVAPSLFNQSERSGPIPLVNKKLLKKSPSDSSLCDLMKKLQTDDLVRNRPCTSTPKKTSMTLDIDDPTTSFQPSPSRKVSRNQAPNLLGSGRGRFQAIARLLVDEISEERRQYRVDTGIIEGLETPLREINQTFQERMRANKTDEYELKQFMQDFVQKLIDNEEFRQSVGLEHPLVKVRQRTPFTHQMHTREHTAQSLPRTAAQLAINLESGSTTSLKNRQKLEKLQILALLQHLQKNQNLDEQPDPFNEETIEQLTPMMEEMNFVCEKVKAAKANYTFEDFIQDFVQIFTINEESNHNKLIPNRWGRITQRIGGSKAQISLLALLITFVVSALEGMAYYLITKK